MEQVQAEEMAMAEAEQAKVAAEQAQAAIATDSTSLATAAEQALNREVEIYGETLSAARNAEVALFTMSNDYLTVDFTTQGGMMSKVTLEEYTKYAPKDERTEKVVLYDPESAEFDMEFYVKRGLNNLKVNTSEYVFQSEGVRKENGCQRLSMRLEVSAGAYVVYEYVLYDEKNPSRDYMLDFNVKFENLGLC